MAWISGQARSIQKEMKQSPLSMQRCIYSWHATVDELLVNPVTRVADLQKSQATWEVMMAMQEGKS